MRINFGPCSHFWFEPIRDSTNSSVVDDNQSRVGKPDGDYTRHLPSPNSPRTGPPPVLLSLISDSPQLQKWKGTIRREERLLDRQISSLKEQEDKSKRMIQQMAKKRPQDVGNVRILAKELVRARKQRQRMYQSKATLNSIQMQLQEQIGNVRFSMDSWADDSHVRDQWDIEEEYGRYEGCESTG